MTDLKEKIEKVDKLFESYNYQLSPKSDNDVRIYTLRYGMYHAAEIVSFNKSVNTTKHKREYSDLGYATEVRYMEDEELLEEYLFEGFFIKTPLGNELKNRYKHFVNRQLQNLPQNSEYSYIKTDFELALHRIDSNLVDNKLYKSEDSDIIVKINELLENYVESILIVIEAPAGFGKTCTAYEILNTFSPSSCKKLPFFTELSRNRDARVFKHILLNEIDEQFPAGIKQNIVLEQIYKGRIPLIIDGFDELITKESNKDEVESMLATIVELLKGQAKIIITSRKTAIFNSEEFYNIIYNSSNTFSLARIEIKEPSIVNWLDEGKLKLLKNSSFPIEQVANPVLLAYIRNITLSKLNEYIDGNPEKALLYKYIEYLLSREQERQNLKIGNDTQLRIFRKLIRLMTEFNITGESKATIKDLIREYNFKILQEVLKLYAPEERPSMDDLTETLSNHVFLDRKPNGNVGFVNDFIFGFLIAENLLLGKFEEHNQKPQEILPKDFAIKSVESFRINNFQKRGELWEVYNKYNYPYENDFYFDIDYKLKKAPCRNYLNLILNDKVIENVIFSENHKFVSCMFYGVNFVSCTFHLNAFELCSFQNCAFNECTVNSRVPVLYNNFALFACRYTNNFRDIIDICYNMNTNTIRGEEDVLKVNEDEILKMFLQVNQIKTRPKKLSFIRQELKGFSEKEINKTLENLKSKNLIHVNNDYGYLTKEGLNYLNHL